MNQKEIRQKDPKTIHGFYSRPAGSASDPSIPNTEDPAIHPSFIREEDNHRLPFPEDGDFREYYRLR
jgi:hypothetical protein